MKKVYWKMKTLNPRQWISVLMVTILTAFQSVAYAQERTVSGTVVDAEDGLGIPGATVLVKGTTSGTTTDFDGNYKLSVPDDAVLVFSFVGYVTVEETVGARSVIDVNLELDVEELQEVVVVGYGAVQKKDVTGVVAKVDEEQFNKGIIASPAELLTGKVAGVSITTSGEPGGAANIRIRGTSSINASSDPLYVIDGVIIDNGGTAGQRNPLNFINTEDIESISVLKDASAAAIYGSRGAKGVVIITTKRSKDGKPQVSYDGYYSVSQFVGEPQIMNADEFRAVVNARYPQYSEDLMSYNTDWVDEVTQTASGMKHAISVSQGGLYLSLMHQTLNGVVRHDKLERNIFNLNYNKAFFDDNMKLNISLKNGFTKNNFGSNQTGTAYDFNPTYPVKSDSSEFGGYFEPRNVGELGTQNPVSQQDLRTNEGRSFRSLGKVEIIANIPWIDGLSWTNNFSFDITSSKNRFFQPLDQFGVFGRGALSYDEAFKSSVIGESFLTYKNSFGNHNAEVVAGYSSQRVWSEGINIFADSLKSDKYTIYDLTQIKRIQTGQYYYENKQESVFGRLNYSYLNKYLVTVNFRLDGSSQFAPANQYVFLPSIALGWRVIDESFASFLNGAFDDFKLRMGYGRLGNQEFDAYLYNTFYYSGTNDARYQFGNDYVTTIRGIAADPGIQWETTETTNIGLDYSLKGGRINGSLEVYQRKTYDLLFRSVIPAGINIGDRVMKNVGAMSNRGIEMELSAVAIDKNDLRWDLAFNVAHNQNEVDEISVGNDFINTGGISGDVGQTIQVIKVGESMNSFYVYEHKMENGLPVNDQGFGTRLDRYVDQNEDGLINENDLVVYNNAFAKVEMGLTSNLSYKNASMSFTMRSKLGNYVYNNVASSKGYFNRMTEFGPNNLHTSVFTTQFNDKQLLSNYYVEDASFLRLDNITLAYTFTQLDFVKIRVYGTAQNVMTITGYSGLDPEVAGGIDNNLYPRSRTFVGGINITF